MIACAFLRETFSHMKTCCRGWPVFFLFLFLSSFFFFFLLVFLSSVYLVCLSGLFFCVFFHFFFFSACFHFVYPGYVYLVDNAYYDGVPRGAVRVRQSISQFVIDRSICVWWNECICGAGQPGELPPAAFAGPPEAAGAPRCGDRASPPSTCGGSAPHGGEPVLLIRWRLAVRFVQV